MIEPTESYLSKARRALSEARAVAAINLPEAAGRAAYLAAYHAAQAFIFARANRITKTHSGVRSEFARLAKDDPRIDRTYSAFLAQAYSLKSIADYAIGPRRRSQPRRSAGGYRYRRSVCSSRRNVGGLGRCEGAPIRRAVLAGRPAFSIGARFASKSVRAAPRNR
jgi:uncharacterized protein (UPF0332 family)